MIYAIGDTHGKLALVKKLYDAIIADVDKIKDPTGSIIIFLGDYVDRGEDSKGVLDFCMSLTDTEDVKHIFLYGNHEDLMFESMYNGNHGHYSTWMNNGGLQTLKSFGFDAPPEGNYDEVLKPYLEWIKNLPFYYLKDDYVFCHSGYFRNDFNISLDVQKDMLIWGRPHPGMYHGNGKVVVHGHTITRDGEPYMDLNPVNYPEVSRINIDVGSFYYNKLCAARLPHGKCTAPDVSFIKVK